MSNSTELSKLFEQPLVHKPDEPKPPKPPKTRRAGDSISDRSNRDDDTMPA